MLPNVSLERGRAEQRFSAIDPEVGEEHGFGELANSANRQPDLFRDFLRCFETGQRRTLDRAADVLQRPQSSHSTHSFVLVMSDSARLVSETLAPASCE